MTFRMYRFTRTVFLAKRLPSMSKITEAIGAVHASGSTAVSFEFFPPKVRIARTVKACALGAIQCRVCADADGGRRCEPHRSH